MAYRIRRRRGGSAEEILADLQRVAGQSNALTQARYQKHGRFSVHHVTKTCGYWNKALQRAGCRISHQVWSKADCLLGIKAVWDRLGRQPRYGEYKELGPQLGQPAISTVEAHHGTWSEALSAFEASSVAETSSETVVTGDGSPNEEPDQPSKPSHPCGEPLGYGTMVYAPVNELGVLVLFSMLAKDMGFVIEAIGSAFPDCLARRRDPRSGRHLRVLIEIEFKSSRFVRHDHPTDGCNMIVCWEHDWADCPPHIEVISLREFLKTRSRSAV